jgi:hypothetical protein
MKHKLTYWFSPPARARVEAERAARRHGAVALTGRQLTDRIERLRWFVRPIARRPTNFPQRHGNGAPDRSGLRPVLAPPSCSTNERLRDDARGTSSRPGARHTSRHVFYAPQRAAGALIKALHFQLGENLREWHAQTRKPAPCARAGSAYRPRPGASVWKPKPPKIGCKLQEPFLPRGGCVRESHHAHLCACSVCRL